jgi:hypothetical protein
MRAMGQEPHAQIRQMPPEIRETTAAATREARMTSPIWRRPWIAFAASATVPGIVLALLGPFGSFSAPLWMRFAYWVPTMAIGAFLGAGLVFAFERIAWFRTRPALRLAAVSLLITLAMAFVAWGAGVLVFGPGQMQFTLTFLAYVAVITFVMMGVGMLVSERERRVAAAQCEVPAPNTVGPPPLIARLPAKLKRESILALQAEDHYVRVHTPAGSDLVLMRLADAIAEMGDTPGARTHRSWWVAKGAVKAVRRANGRPALVLANDAEVPISRGYASELREAGWLD